jgi:hypothetical protein
MLEWLMNWKWIAVEVVVTSTRCPSGNCLDGELRKITQNLSQGSRCPCRDSNRASPKRKSRPLPLHQAAWFSPIYSSPSFIMTSPIFVSVVLRHILRHSQRNYCRGLYLHYTFLLIFVSYHAHTLYIYS